ncbi:MAG: helix-turn-helix transcriptional regulator [Woeseiaceae bacterium]
MRSPTNISGFDSRFGNRQPVEGRHSVLHSDLARVEGISVAGLSREPMPVVHTPQFQVLFPLAGVFNWHLGATVSLLNANQILFIAAGDESQDSHPGIGDVDGLLLTPGHALLKSAWACDIHKLARAPGFAERVLPSDPRLQQAAAALARYGARTPLLDEGVIEEAVVDLLAVTAAHAGARSARFNNESKLANAVKEIVSSCDQRLSLTDIGAQLGASPTYLTDAFRRSVGIPISQYHRRLRLARALTELPHTDDITALALRFGFSSHAHFSSAFRDVFGRTPSEYRARVRKADIRSLLQRIEPVT